MHFGQPASIGQLEALLVSFDELWSVLKHFGQPGSTMVSLEKLWSAWVRYGQPGSTMVSLEALWSAEALWLAKKPFGSLEAYSECRLQYTTKLEFRGFTNIDQ